MTINELAEQKYRTFVLNKTYDSYDALMKETELTKLNRYRKEAFIAGAELAIGFSQWVYDNCTEGYSYWMYDGLQYNHTDLFQIYLNQLNNK